MAADGGLGVGGMGLLCVGGGALPAQKGPGAGTSATQLWSCGRICPGEEWATWRGTVLCSFKQSWLRQWLLRGWWQNRPGLCFVSGAGPIGVVWADVLCLRLLREAGSQGPSSPTLQAQLVAQARALSLPFSSFGENQAPTPMVTHGSTVFSPHPAEGTGASGAVEGCAQPQ